MRYVLKSGDKYLAQISNGPYSLVDNPENAIKWKEFSKADNFRKTMKNCKIFKGAIYFKVEEYSDNGIVVQNEALIQEKEVQLTESNSQDFLEKIDELKKFVSELQNRKELLGQEVAKCDMEIIDIEHYAEFFELNAAQGYKIYKLLHDVRVRKRKCKNELHKIGYILSATLNHDSLDCAEKSIKGLDNQKYTPRILKELFNV